MGDIGHMSFSDVHWDSVVEVADIREADSTVVIRCINSRRFRVQIPFDLMRGCIEHGKTAAEQRFMDQDLQRDDEQHGLY